MSTAVPNFLILGAQKCGTTWLTEMLRQHPDVYLPREPELHYFNKTEKQTDAGWREYLEHFRDASNQSAIGEKCTSYFWTWNVNSHWCKLGGNREIPETIHRRLGPDARFIVCVRNPVDRAISAFFHHMRMERRVLATENIINLGHRWGIVDIGFYNRHLRRWMVVYPIRNFLFLVYEEDILRDPKAGLQKVWRFLDIDESFIPDNYTERIYQGLPRKSENGILRLASGEGPPVKPEHCLTLLDIYREDIKKLQRTLKRDLSEWESSIIRRWGRTTSILAEEQTGNETQDSGSLDASQ